MVWGDVPPRALAGRPESFSPLFRRLTGELKRLPPFTLLRSPLRSNGRVRQGRRRRRNGAQNLEPVATVGHPALAPQPTPAQVERNTISFIRASFGDTTGIVSIVLATAISSSAVKVSFVMICLSSSTLAKMIMISALV